MRTRWILSFAAVAALGASSLACKSSAKAEPQAAATPSLRDSKPTLARAEGIIASPAGTTQASQPAAAGQRIYVDKDGNRRNPTAEEIAELNEAAATKSDEPLRAVSSNPNDPNAPLKLNRQVISYSVVRLNPETGKLEESCTTDPKKAEDFKNGIGKPEHVEGAH